MIENVPPITNVMVQVTNQCNLLCKYCFVDKSVNRMTYQKLREVVDFIVKNSESCGVPPRLCFFGGEPMLEWDTLIVPLINYIRNEYQKPFYLSITTNCMLLDETRLKFLRDNHVSCLFSTDGDRETQNINRPQKSGADSFDVVDKNIDSLLQYSPNATARITVHGPTIKNFFRDLMYVENKGFKKYSVLPNLFETWTKKDIYEFKRQVTSYGDYLISSFRAGRTPALFEQYDEMFYMMMLSNKCVTEGRYQTIQKCQGCGKCGFGLKHFATVDYLGNIYGCLHLSNLDPSNIFYLGDVTNGVNSDRSLALIEKCDSDALGGIDCINCKLNHICDRGCVPNNYLHNGTFGTPPPIFCHFNRTLFEDAVRVCAVLGAEKNEAFKVFFQQRVANG